MNLDGEYITALKCEKGAIRSLSGEKAVRNKEEWNAVRKAAVKLIGLKRLPGE